MNRVILSLLIALAWFCTAIADEEQEREPLLEDISEKILQGEIPVGKELSMDYKRGRYHEIHVDVLGLDCHTCHYGKAYQPDYLLLRKYEFLRKRAKGQFNREACLACHQEEGIATVFYKGRAGKK